MLVALHKLIAKAARTDVRSTTVLMAALVTPPAALAVQGTLLDAESIAPQSCAVMGAYGICSATQIGDTSLLSAAHCFDADDPQPPMVKCGDEPWQATEQVTLHPFFDPRPVPGEPFPNDVAIISTGNQMTAVPAIPVFDRGLFQIILNDENADCQLSGYGGSNHYRLKEAAIRYDARFHKMDAVRGDLLRQEDERIESGDSGGGVLCNWYGDWYAMAVHETVNKVELTYTDDNSMVIHVDRHTYGMSRPLYHYQTWRGAQELIR